MADSLSRGELWNPYDFANPVNDEKLFAGRDNELSDIRYYLGQASRAPRPINLVLTGSRSSGKTSLLNKIAHEAKSRNFCVARIDLNEADASPLNLFYKIYDAVLIAAVTDGAFAGLSGSVYRHYRQIMDAGTGADAEPIELLFPRHYAAASGGHRMLSEPTLKMDLHTISHQVGKPCVLLFDECDVLGNSRVELEMLRNVFMNTPGYMLVFAGTPHLFPVMEEVFSPIVRQFKKIPVKNFDSEDDTRSCIVKPLQRVALTLDDVQLTRATVADIHRLSDGRPYEIQLLCHHMFRRFEEGRAKTMGITLDVLDEVLTELETQDAETDTGRNSVVMIRHMQHDDLLALASLTQANATLRELWLLAQLFDDTELDLDDLKLACESFVRMKLIRIDNAIIYFEGDQFDEVYARYAAAAKDVYLIVRAIPFEIALDFELSLLVRQIDFFTPIFGPLSPDDAMRRLEKVIASLIAPDVPKNLPDLTELVYPSLIDSLPKGSLALARVVLEVDGQTASSWSAIASEQATIIDETTFESIPELVSLRDRLTAVGGSLVFEVFNYPLPNEAHVVRRIRAVASSSQLDEFADAHADFGYRLYEGGINGEALKQFAIALALWPTGHHATPCAHLNLLDRNWREAESFATYARLLSKEDSQDADLTTYVIATYDLAVASAAQRDYSSSSTYLDECREKLDSTVDTSGHFVVLGVESDDCIIVREVEDLEQAMTSLEAFVSAVP